MRQIHHAFMEKIVQKLSDNYKNFPFDVDSLEPANWLENFSSQSEANDSVIAEFINSVSRMDCFTYRAVNKNGNDNNRLYFNALEECYDEFQTANTIVYQNEYPYPTPDMVIAWCHSQREA